MTSRAEARPKTGRFSLSNIKTKPKVLLAVAVPLLVIGGIALVNLARMDRTQGWVDHTHMGSVLPDHDAVSPLEMLKEIAAGAGAKGSAKL